MGILKNIWDKSKDGNKQEQRSLIRVTIIASAVALVFLCVKKDNLFQWIKAGITISKQNSEIKANRERLEQMDRTIYLLTHDRDSLEKFARENFHFAQKDDDIYLIDD
ncbi:MAG: hypothetical protein UD286_06365 [Bacteroidales bacterium]|nr:hypothetical protein [Bacteroidales bacterium]